jgi:hypothetical protein
MSEEQFNERIERALRREIERVNAASQGGIP